MVGALGCARSCSATNGATGSEPTIHSGFAAGTRASCAAVDTSRSCWCGALQATHATTRVLRGWKNFARVGRMLARSCITLRRRVRVGTAATRAYRGPPGLAYPRAGPPLVARACGETVLTRVALAVNDAR